MIEDIKDDDAQSDPDDHRTAPTEPGEGGVDDEVAKVGKSPRDGDIGQYE